MKKKWSSQKELRRKAVGNANSRGEPTGSGARHWNVLKITPKRKMKSHFEVTALRDGAVKRFTVEVPKMFYINYAREPETLNYFEGKKIKRMLPRCKVAEHLYQVEMSSKEFEQNSNYLLSLLTRQEVEGLYELQVFLLWLFVLVILGFERKLLFDRLGVSEGK